MDKGIGYYTLHKDKIINDIMDYMRQHPQGFNKLAHKMGIAPRTLMDFVRKSRPQILSTSVKIDNWLEIERNEGRLK